jgi:WD40 repeat protein
MAFDPDGRQVAIAIWCAGDARDNDPGHVEVWDLIERRKLHSISGHESFVLGVASSPDGRQIASARLDRTARIYDAATGAAVQVLRGHQRR